MTEDMTDMDELPCIVESFRELWDSMDVRAKIDHLQQSDYETYVSDGFDADNYEFDYVSAMKELWWYPLADLMSAGHFETGELWDYRGVPVMLACRPTGPHDPCWLMDARLVSTMGLIEEDATDWAVD